MILSTMVFFALTTYGHTTNNNAMDCAGVYDTCVRSGGIDCGSKKLACYGGQNFVADTSNGSNEDDVVSSNRNKGANIGNDDNELATKGKKSKKHKKHARGM